MAEKIGIRPCVILLNEDKTKILCIECKYSDGEYFLFPGGGVERGETLRECAVREMEEETGIKVKITQLAYVNDWIANKETNERVVNVFFLSEQTGGELIQGPKDGGKVKTAMWISLDDFENIDFRPNYVAKRLKNDVAAGFNELKSYFFE